MSRKLPLPRTSFSSNGACVIGDEGRWKRHSGLNQADEEGGEL